MERLLEIKRLSYSILQDDGFNQHQANALKQLCVDILADTEIVLRKHTEAKHSVGHKKEVTKVEVEEEKTDKTDKAEEKVDKEEEKVAEKVEEAVVTPLQPQPVPVQPTMPYMPMSPGAPSQVQVQKEEKKEENAPAQYSALAQAGVPEPMVRRPMGAGLGMGGLSTAMAAAAGTKTNQEDGGE